MKKLCLSLIFILSISLGFTQIPLTSVSWDQIESDALRHLSNLVAIPTALPEPDEIGATRYIYKELNKHNIDWDIFIPHPEKANILARIKGSDNTLKPLLLIAHLDTISLMEGWNYPPFKATLVDDKIYGLGITDAKNYLAVYLAIFTYLHDLPSPPQRDIIFLATSGEESGSETGLLWLQNTFWNKINPGFALSEGGGIIPTEDSTLIFAEASSKKYVNLQITAHGIASHSSIPTEDNAVYILSQALSKIAKYDSPAKLTTTTNKFFSAILPLQDEDGKTTINLLLNGTPQNQQNAANIMAQDPFFKSQLKDIISPTSLNASPDSNTITEEATAIVNIRLLPNSDVDELVKNLSDLFSDTPNITLKVLEQPQNPFPMPMDGSDELFAAIEKTATQLFPKAITVPGLSPASGDNELLRRLGIITYGLGPVMNPLQENPTHTANEFITKSEFITQLKFTFGILSNFAYPTELSPLPSTDIKEIE